jgi:thiamine kinase-like enzyme
MDWEYAGNGDPVWDLAYLSKYGEFNQKQDLILLDAYFNKSFEEIDELRMFIYKPAVAFMVLQGLVYQNLKKVRF